MINISVVELFTQNHIFVLLMANVLDFVEPGPLLTPEATNAPRITKATVRRCLSKLSPYWTDEQLDQVVEMFQAHGLL